MAFQNLCQTIQHAKCKWVHNQLYHTIDTKDIWAMAKTQKEQPTNTFPPLWDQDNQLINQPTKKAKVFCHQFFPTQPKIVQLMQPKDPTLLPT